jgi:hypothetical protein
MGKEKSPKKYNTKSSLPPSTNINLRWILDFNITSNSRMVLGGNIKKYICKYEVGIYFQIGLKYTEWKN